MLQLQQRKTKISINITHPLEKERKRTDCEAGALW